MREILFRGKREDNGEWVYGYFTGENSDTPFSPPIREENIIQKGTGWWVRVDPETVGQYTGMKDKNGTKIFEGDVLIVPFDDKPLCIKFEDGIFTAERVGSQYWLFMWEAALGKVIGNIHDNPELIGGDE